MNELLPAHQTDASDHPRASRGLRVAGVFLALVVCTLVLPLIHAARGLAEVEVRSVPRRLHGGQLARSAPFGEVIHSDAEGLWRIDLAVAALGAEREEELVMRLRDGLEGPVLREARTHVRAAPGPGSFAQFEFEPLEDSAGRELHVEFLPTSEESSLAPWWRYRGMAGFDRPWGDRVLAGQVHEGMLPSPRGMLSAVAFPFEFLDTSAGGATLELWNSEGQQACESVLGGAGVTRNGFAVFPFEPLAGSRALDFRFRLTLPAGSRLIGTEEGPSVTTFHGRGVRSSGLLGATRGRAHFPDRNLILRLHGRPGWRVALARTWERLGPLSILALLLWLIGAYLVVDGWLVPGTRRNGVSRWLVPVVLHLLVFQVVLPPWMGEDEPWQFEYAALVAAGHRPSDGQDFDRSTLRERPYSSLQVVRRLPSVGWEEVASLEAEILASMREHDFSARVDWNESWEGQESFDDVAAGFTGVQHPPLYPLVLQPFVGDATASPAGRLRRARVLSLLCALATVAATFVLGRALFGDDVRAGAAALALGWLPTFARHGAVANNDVLAMAATATVLALCARRLAGRESRAELLIAGVACAAGLATKTTAAVSLLALAALVFLRPTRVRGARLGAVLGVLAVGALCAYAWSAHNTALPDDLSNLGARIARSFTLERLRELTSTATGSFNWYSRPSAPIWQVLWSAAALLALLAAARRWRELPSRLTHAVLALALICLVGQLGLVVLRGVAHFRYLLPVAPLLAVLWIAAFGDRSRPDDERGLRVSIALVVLHAGWFLWGGLIPDQYWSWGA